MIALLWLIGGAWNRLRLAFGRAVPTPCNDTRAPCAPKPEWVKREILRLKADMPRAGCRTIEMIFNRRFGPILGVTVSKTYIAKLLLAHRLPVRARPRARSVARLWPHNERWGIDLTSLFERGRRYLILGVIEYRSRALILLVVLMRKSAAVLTRSLGAAFERFGAPRSVVTDNEGPFRSNAWRALLARFGVRHQRIRPHCPWQNGRIERFFGTLKEKLRQRGARGLAALQRDLRVFQYWYNRVRPHQALRAEGSKLFLTPAESWESSARRERGTWFEGWDGLLRGYECRI